MPAAPFFRFLAIGTAWLAAGAALAAEEVLEGTDASEGLFPPFDTGTYAGQLFWLALTFGFLYWFLKEKALPRVERTLEDRAQRIDGDRTSARRAREEADAAEAAYTQELAEARQNATRIAGEARDQTNREADAKRRDAEADLDRRLKEAEERIAAMKNDAMSHVEEIARDVTGAIIAQVTKRSYPEDRIREAVREAAAQRGA